MTSTSRIENHRLDRDTKREFLGAVYPRAIGVIDTNLGIINDSAGIQVEAAAAAER